MDNNGLPVTYELFSGNTNDCLTYRPNFGRIKKQFDLGRVITVADKAMCTGDNIWYTINTPTHDGMYSVCLSAVLIKPQKNTFSTKMAMNGWEKNTKENPVDIHAQSM